MRTPMRKMKRNGDRSRDWDSRADRIALKIPTLRQTRGAAGPGV